MEQYTIPCTEEQTRKANELGAPIKYEVECPVNLETLERSPYQDIKMGKDGEPILIIPTTEQMLGWLESQYLYVTIRYTNDIDKHWQADIDHACYIDPKCGQNLVDFNFSSRKEATLAAIDAALNYLVNNRK